MCKRTHVLDACWHKACSSVKHLISKLTILCCRAIDYKNSWVEDVVLLWRLQLGIARFCLLGESNGKLFCDRRVGPQVLTLPESSLSQVQIHLSGPEWGMASNLCFQMKPWVFLISQLPRWEHFCSVWICCCYFKGKISLLVLSICSSEQVAPDIFLLKLLFCS